ncbi:Zinc finger, RING/FYVE/PHD-type [Corchorus olitorius]|uniref:Zinc finger, RING/FYVE/PHD-type n=1 Tax=Corchorus olitorius TaxID=93759 RepID=A0A1R3KK44_9ROSI|nr:Zinc finger, RING/FYVE/PHD-type [Corchorus olitorius]
MDDDDGPKPKLENLMLCKLCEENKPYSLMFKETQCRHYFCLGCIHQHIATKMKENIIRIPCPQSGCGRLLIPKTCFSLLPVDVVRRWDIELYYSVTAPVRVFACPYCSAPLSEEELVLDDGLKHYDCPRCSQSICASCFSFEHGRLGCLQFY